MRKKLLALGAAAAVAGATIVGISTSGATSSGALPTATTPIEHVVVLFPENISAYSNLALVYALTGRPAEATTMLRRMTEAMPSPASYAEAARTYRALGDERGAQAILRYARRRFPDSEILKQLAQAA